MSVYISGGREGTSSISEWERREKGEREFDISVVVGAAMIFWIVGKGERVPYPWSIVVKLHLTKGEDRLSCLKYLQFERGK